MQKAIVYGCKLIGILAFTVVSGFFCGCSEKTSQEHPNVLFIMVDDLRPELNCYDNNQILSPNIDRLAENGVLFQHAYCQQAICMASRASIFSGYYANTNRIYSCLSVKELMPDVLTINKFFSHSGYEVAGIGKLYHHAADHVEQFGNSWSETQKQAKGKTKGRGYITQDAIAGLTPEGRGPAWEIADVDDNEYRDGYYADWAVNKLKELKERQKPFFLGVGFHKPHLPFNAPRKYWDLYPPEQIELASNPFYPENGSYYGKHNFGELRNYTNIPKGDTILTEETQKTLIRAYHACVSYIDAQLGKILDALEANDLTQNTVVVLLGDHGWKLGEHGMWCKHTDFELDTRIPLIINAPKFKRNVKTKAFAEYVDLFPTLVDLCGFEIPSQLQGKSLVPVLKDPSANVKEQAFSVWPSYRAPRNDPEKAILGFSVRTQKFRYTEWIQIHTGELLDRELYDHELDPMENKNEIDNENYRTELPKLSALIKDFRQKNENGLTLKAE